MSLTTEDNLMIHETIGRLKKEQDFSGLESYLLSILGEHPNHVISISHLADLYIQLGRYDEAKKYLESGLAIKPGYGPLHLNYGKLLHFQFKDYEQAVYHYEQAILDDDYPIAYENLHDIYLNIYNDVDKAYDIISEGIQAVDDYANFYAQLAYIQYYHRNNPEIAISLLEKALSIEKNGRYLTYIGQIHKNEKNYEQAYEYFKQALVMGELNQLLVLELTELLLLEYHDVNQAIELLKEAAEQFSNEAIYPAYLANLYMSLNQVDEARHYLTIAEERPNKPQDILLVIGFLKAMLENDTEDAMMYFEKVVEIDPHNLNALSIVGFYKLFNDQQIELALNYFNKIIELGAPVYSVYFVTAELYQSYFRNYTKALEVYLKIDPEQLPKRERSQLYFLIGKVYDEGFQDRHQALNYFEKAYETNPNKQLEQFLNQYYESDKTLIN